MSWVKKFDKTGFVIENPKVLLNLSLQEERWKLSYMCSKQFKQVQRS